MQHIKHLLHVTEPVLALYSIHRIPVTALVHGLQTHVPPLHHPTLLFHNIVCLSETWMTEYDG